MTTSLEELQALAASGKYDLVPMTAELYADDTTPITVLRRLRNVSHHVFLLESVENSAQGRYTFLGYDPSMEITCKDGTMRVTAGSTVEFVTDDPGSCIRDVLQQNKSPRVASLPPFTGGLVGYFSYDYLKYSEPSLTLDARDEEGFNDVDLMLFDKVICFDSFQQKILIIVNVRTAQLQTDFNRAKAEIETIAGLIKNGEPRIDKPGRITSDFKPLFQEEAFCNMVERAKQYIREGDIFQVVLSNRLEASFEGSLLDTYRVLRSRNPSPYMFYFTSDDMELAGASPETLVKLQDGTVTTFPLAGTRPRGATPEEDERITAELLADEKELAEHNMLVDLGRNDIGKISEYGSVQVTDYLSIQRFSHVMHIGSTVSGTLRKDLDALAAVDSILPAGTLSGAPKIRACQIINDLEDNKRGVYGGAIGYLSFTGDLDLCIAIRLVFKKNGKVFVRAGAGIVADSVPASEYQETINKAKAVRLALQTAQGGID